MPSCTSILFEKNPGLIPPLSIWYQLGSNSTTSALTLGILEQNYELQKGQLSGCHFGGIDMGVNRFLQSLECAVKFPRYSGHSAKHFHSL